jgi:hypothetical protein
LDFFYYNDTTLAVALVSVAYDHLLTFDQEIQNIWGSKSSQGYVHKITFFLNRYVAEAVTAYTAFGTTILLKMKE